MHFETYIDRTSANLMLVAARALGPAERGVVRDAGRALGLANWLRAIPALERAGRVPLVDGRPEAVRALARDGLESLARARGRRRAVSAAARPALMPLWQAGGALRRARRDPARVAAGRLDPAPAWRRLGLLTRAATGLW